MQLPMRDADVSYEATFFTTQRALELFYALRHETDWRSERITLRGRSHEQPRLTAWHGDSDAEYRYSGLHLVPAAWTATLHELRRHVEARSNTSFNSVLLNLYRNERDSMGMHSDDEPELGAEPVIASLSFGATRVLSFRHKHIDATYKLALEAGSLLVMRGQTQACWRHGIAKRIGPTGERINLTFRRIEVLKC